MSTLARASMRQATIEFAVHDGTLVGTIGLDDGPPVPFAGVDELERVIARAARSRTPLVLVRPEAPEEPAAEPSHDEPRPSLAHLTARELEIVATAARGASNREIADEMFYSVKSVEAYLTRVYRKLGLSGRSDLVQLWRSRTASEIEDLEVSGHIARGITGGVDAVGAVVRRPAARARVTLVLLAEHDEPRSDDAERQPS